MLTYADARTGGVVSLIHDRGKRTLTFLVNDAPPVTLNNVPPTVRPFVNAVFFF